MAATRPSYVPRISLIMSRVLILEFETMFATALDVERALLRARDFAVTLLRMTAVINTAAPNILHAKRPSENTRLCRSTSRAFI
jgi:hypothetical protein